MMMARCVSGFILLGMLLLAAGCAGLGLVASDIAGTPTVPAMYVPPKEPTLVLVENNLAIEGGEADCDRLGRYVSQDLTNNKVVPLVDFEPLVLMRDRDPLAYSKMSIAALGRATGAKQVIYVSVVQYGEDAPLGSDSVKWKASVRVKVVDVATGASRWPADLAEGRPVTAETDYKATAEQVEGESGVRDLLNKTLADKVSKLFHDWQQDTDQPEDYQQ
jgi:hypothetical protein